MRELERFVILQVVDQRWREHLENMDYLREGVHLRAMAQKDPLVEYRGEGHKMFEELATRSARRSCSLFHAELAPEEAAEPAAAAEAPAAHGALRTSTSRWPARTRSRGQRAATAVAVGGAAVPQQRVVASTSSSAATTRAGAARGKKYKKCHGA